MNKMKRKPTHPGKIIQEDYLKPLSITITEMASTLGVSRKTLSKIINERGAITPDMSLRLAGAFDTTPELWMNLQKIMIYGRLSIYQRIGKGLSLFPCSNSMPIYKNQRTTQLTRSDYKTPIWLSGVILINPLSIFSPSI